MTEMHSKIRSKVPRIVLTESIMTHFFNEIFNGSVTELRQRSGLSYRLIYNIVNRRVKSISAREYRLIFGQAPPAQPVSKVNGDYFRSLVALWLYLNDHATKSDLYREVFGKKNTKRVDYRIFTGKTQSIDSRIERTMEEVFLNQGLDRRTLENWIDELENSEQGERVPYRKIEPVLQFLEENAGIHPSSLLNQYVERYKSGKLQSVSKNIFNKAMALKQKVEQGQAASNKLVREKIKEEVYGRKQGYTLYGEIEEELIFLQQYARKSPKRYLGRSTTVYAREGCKRITTQRALRIKADCDAFIRQNPHLKLKSLPGPHRNMWLGVVLSLLKRRVTDLLFLTEGVTFEKHILAPHYSSSEYKKPANGFTQFELAPRALGIKKNVFDLMVATNCEIFKMVGQYNNRWYLSDLYLKELSERKYFDLITAKYERLAKKQHFSQEGSTCMQ